MLRMTSSDDVTRASWLAACDLYSTVSSGILREPCIYQVVKARCGLLTHLGSHFLCILWAECDSLGRVQSQRISPLSRHELVHSKAAQQVQKHMAQHQGWNDAPSLLLGVETWSGFWQARHQWTCPRSHGCFMWDLGCR